MVSPAQAFLGSPPEKQQRNLTESRHTDCLSSVHASQTRKSASARGQSAKKNPSIRPKDDGATIRRGITVRAPIAEVKRLWKQRAFPGKAEFNEAPGDRGTELRVTATAKQQRSFKEVATAYQGNVAHDQLSTVLREIKAKLETGEVPTTLGQPSGRVKSK